MIFTRAEIPVKSETRGAALDIVRTIASQSREEDGVIEYRATTDIEDPNLIHILEHYEDMDAVDAHNASEHLETFQADIEAHLDGEPKLYRFVVDSVSERPGP